MVEIPPKTLEKIKDEAKKLISSEDQTCEILTHDDPNAHVMFILSKEKEVLTPSIFELQIDGTTVYIGRK